MGNLSNTTINGVSYDFKDAGAARQSHSHTKSQITDFPTSMPASDVPSWAKASSKPSYTASEVGAVPNTSAGVSAAINLLSTGDSAPTDNDYYVSQYAGGGSSTTTYHRRPVSKLWDYIKSKFSLSTTGSGNAVTGVSYSNGAFTVTKGSSFAASSHTHNYAGSSSAGGAATSANKLNTNAGSATQPVYFSNGVPVATTYSLGKSVPSNAKFTDTTYSVATTSANGLMSSGDKTIVNALSNQTWTAVTVSSASDVSGGYMRIGKLCLLTLYFSMGSSDSMIAITGLPIPLIENLAIPICCKSTGLVDGTLIMAYGRTYSADALKARYDYSINAIYMAS